MAQTLVRPLLDWLGGSYIDSYVLTIFSELVRYRERYIKDVHDYGPFWTYLSTHVRCFLYYAYYLSPIFAEITTYPKIGRPL